MKKLFVAEHPSTDGANIWNLRQDGLAELVGRDLDVSFIGGKRLLVPTSELTQAFDLSEFAVTHNAVIMTDVVGDVALQQRHTDGEGVGQVRCAPDPCDYKSLGWWLTATPEQRVFALA
jgi:hypothetical protein